MTKTRILFVDDEPNVLDGLQRMLRRQRDEWDMVFAQSGAEALAQLALGPFDVIVSDMQMPGIDGAELLESVTASYPEVARIVLSGHTDETSAARVLKVAHQFLSKPTDAETLRTAVARACTARQSVANPRIRSITASIGTLPSPPRVYVEITRAAGNEGVTAHDIAAIIARDPAVSAKLLQLVNSSFFALGRRVSSVEHAVTLLGLTRIKSLILSAQILHEFRPARAIRGFSIMRLLHRSVQVAQTARLISVSEHQDGDRPDQAYVAGLLHDVGLLVLAARQPEGLIEALRRATTQQTPLCVAERAVLDAAHPDIAACLLELWSLPPRIIEGVRLHHDPGESPFGGLSAVTMVHVAAALDPELHSPGPAGDNPEGVYAPRLDTAYLTRIGADQRLAAWRDVARAGLAPAQLQPPVPADVP